MATLIRRDNPELGRRRAVELDPFRLIDALFGTDGFSGGFATDPWGGHRAFAPTFDVHETKDAYVFKADVPGVAEKDLDVQMTGNILAIAGERKHEGVQQGERYFAVERAHGRFSRSFALPEGADGERVTADMKDGVLTVRVPKKPEVQPRRISVG